MRLLHFFVVQSSATVSYSRILSWHVYKVRDSVCVCVCILAEIQTWHWWRSKNKYTNLEISILYFSLPIFTSAGLFSESRFSSCTFAFSIYTNKEKELYRVVLKLWSVYILQCISSGDLILTICWVFDIYTQRNSLVHVFCIRVWILL